MIWVKTEAGRAEVQHRTVLKDRSLRALLVLVDGKKSEEDVLRSLPGSTLDGFKRLHELELVEPRAALGHAVALAHPMAVTARSTTPTRTLSSADFENLVARLTKLISVHLGLAGLSLTIALEKAQTFEELALVARRTLEQIRGQRGPQAAAIAREALRRLIDD